MSRTSSWESNDHIQGVICRGHGYSGEIRTYREDLCRGHHHGRVMITYMRSFVMGMVTGE